MTDKLLKFLLIGVVLLIAAPFIVPMLPKAATFERAKEAYETAGYTVTDYKEGTPSLQAVDMATMRIKDVGLSGARVDLYLYDDEGKIVKNLTYQKSSSGTTLPGLAALATSLGAAKNPNLPCESARNGMMMIVATGEDRDELKMIVKIFKRL